MRERPDRPAVARRCPRHLVAAMVILLAGLALVAPAAAEPGEDGADPDPPGFYDPTPLSGWMTTQAGDRVRDIAQIGNTVYVAGTFAAIRPGPGQTAVAQANLAAFDATTGEHLAAFDPVVPDTVYSLAVAPDGSALFVGGTFASVDGQHHVRLAALDPATGDPLAGFDADVGGGAVRSVVVRGNQLYVGGNFASVSGVARSRLARVDATTGALDPTWVPSATGGSVLTLEIPTDGGRVYVGGRFTAVGGAGASSDLAALSPVTGAVDPTFTGQPGREVYDLVATDDGRVYVAEGGPLGRAEAYDAAGALVARWDTNGDVQAVEQIGDLVFFGGHDFGPDELENVAVVDPDDLTEFDVELFKAPPDGGDGVWAFHATAGSLWLGGQHSGPYHGFARYSPTAPPPPREDLVSPGSTWRFLDDGTDPGGGWIQPGFGDGGWGQGDAELGFGDGDEATTLESGHIAYRFRRTFTVTGVDALSDVAWGMVVDDGAVAYLNGTEIARHNMPAGPVGGTTLASSTVFGPAESMFTSFDVPDGLLVDGANTLAVSVHQADAGSSDVSFDGRLSAARALPDTTPPSVPGGLDAVDRAPTSFRLQWQPSTDDTGVDHYEVFGDGTPIDTTTDTTLVVSDLAPSTTYQMTVEAVDAAGNRSGPSPALSVTTQDPPPVTDELIPLGSTWAYLDDGSDQGTAWRAPGFDDGAWETGPAELGVGDGDEATVLAGGPVTYWFRHAFTVASATAVGGLDLELLVDDGAVVYLNGVEVVRDNMPAGPVTASTNAVDYRFGAAEQELRAFTVPPTALVDGTNVLAVEVHQAPGSVDLSFDARLDSTEAPPADIAGVITEDGSGTPLEDVWVAAVGPLPGVIEVRAGAFTNGSGGYALRDLPAGDYLIAVFDPGLDHGFEYVEDTPDPQAATLVSVVPGVTATVDAGLAVTTPPPGGAATLSGAVAETGSGAPIADALVIAVGSGGLAGIGRADPTGAYSLDLAPGDYWLEFVDPTGDHRGEWYADHALSEIVQANAVTVGPGGLTLDVELALF